MARNRWFPAVLIVLAAATSLDAADRTSARVNVVVRGDSGAAPGVPVGDQSPGVLNGTPTTYGTFAFTIQTTDASGCSGTRSFLLTITCPVITLMPETLPTAVIGAAYNQTLAAQGGSVPYAFSLIGTLPPGLSLSSAGGVTGTPTTVGTYNVALKAIDANG